MANVGYGKLVEANRDKLQVEVNIRDNPPLAITITPQPEARVGLGAGAAMD